MQAAFYSKYSLMLRVNEQYGIYWFDYVFFITKTISKQRCWISCFTDVIYHHFRWNNMSVELRVLRLPAYSYEKFLFNSRVITNTNNEEKLEAFIDVFIETQVKTASLLSCVWRCSTCSANYLWYNKIPLLFTKENLIET